MAAPKWNYMLRIHGRNPQQMALERMGDYMREFACLLGHENEPRFAGIKEASTGLRALVPAKHRLAAWKRVQTAKTRADSAPARHFRAIEKMLGEDALHTAELLDADSNVVHLFHGKRQPQIEALRVKQRGEVDGLVTGLVGADSTMHLHLRDHLSRDLKFVVTNERLARQLLQQFRAAYVRLQVHGTWLRTPDGWVPENNKCSVDSFEVLDGASASDVADQIASAKGNGWREIGGAHLAWVKLREGH